jgi:hypothetical protein
VRALSVRQPYAELIIRGNKTVEYRSKPTNIRERVYIYAARRSGKVEYFERARRQPGELPTSVFASSRRLCHWKRGIRFDVAFPMLPR